MNDPLLDRRSFLSTAALVALSPVARAQQRRAPQTPSLSRQVARWAAALRYEDLPPAVVDRAKGLTVQALASILVGSKLPAGEEAIKVSEEEAGVRDGATVMVAGVKATKGGA